MNKHITEEKLTPGPELTPWDPREAFVLPAVRSWGLVLLTTLLGALAGAFMGLTKENQYTSTAKVAVRAGQRQLLAVDTIPDEQRRLGLMSYYLVPDEIELISSQEVFEEVVREIGPDRILTPYDPLSRDTETTPIYMRKLHEFQSWWFGVGRAPLPADDPGVIRAAVEVLRGGLEVTSEELSSVIRTSYTANSQQLAKDVTDAFVKAHDVRHRAIYSLSEPMQVWHTKRDGYQTQVREAETELSQFQTLYELFDPASQSAGLTTNGKAVEWQIEEADRAIEHHQEKVAKLQAQLAATPSTWARPNLDPRYDHSQQMLMEAIKKLNELKITYKDDSEEVIQMQKQIATLESEVARYDRYVDPSQPIEQVPNPEYVDLKERIETLLDQVGEQLVRTQVRRDYLEWINQRLSQISELTPRFEELKRRVESLKELSDKYQHAIDTFDLAALRDESAMSNLRVLQEGTFPLEKSGPNRRKLGLAGVAAGLLIGSALAALRNAFNRTVRRPKELQTLLSAPLLAVVPATGGWRRAQRSMRKLPPR